MTQPRYHFENSQGQHAHFLGDTPLIGTSSVCKILAKPLTWWASGLAVQTFGCLDPKVMTKMKRGTATQAEKDAHMGSLKVMLSLIKSMDVQQYADLCDMAYRAHSVKLTDSAQAGTNLHAELERFVKWRMEQQANPTGLELVLSDKLTPFVEWSNDHVKRFLWSEGHCYSSKHWLGGICDAGYIGNDGRLGIIDFKSAKDAYPEHFWQIGGYDLQISEGGVFTADGDLLYTLEQPVSRYAVVPFGAKHVEPRFYEAPDTARNVFLSMLTIYNATPRD